MSYDHIRAARDLHDDGLDLNARYVLLVLSTYTNRAGLAWASVATLAAAAELAPRTVYRCLHDAQAVGLTAAQRLGRTTIYDLGKLPGVTPNLGNTSAKSGGNLGNGEREFVDERIKERKERVAALAIPRGIYRDDRGYLFVTDEQLTMEV